MGVHRVRIQQHWPWKSKQQSPSQLASTRDVPLPASPLLTKNNGTGDAAYRLPPEITDIILDHLHDDKFSLAACSLVSRCWLQTCRYHLFAALAVVRMAEEGFLDFLHFLEDSPDICTYVHTLSLSGNSFGDAILGGPPERRPELCPYVLGRILARLPSLRALTLQWVQFSHRSLKLGYQPWKRIRRFLKNPRASSSLTRRDICACERPDISGTRNLTKLDSLLLYMVGSTSDTIRGIVDTLALFSEVSDFTTLRLSIAGSEKAHLEQLAQRPLLSQLQVRSICAVLNSHPLFHILRQSPSIHTLTSVDASCETWAEAVSLGALLAEAGTHINLLELDPLCIILREGSIPLDSWNALNLASCTSLHALTLVIDVSRKTDFDDHYHLSLCTAVLDILSFVPPTISYVTFDVLIQATPSGDPLNKYMDWGRMERILNNMEALQTVTFQPPGWKRPATESLLNCSIPFPERLSGLQRRITLTVQ